MRIFFIYTQITWFDLPEGDSLYVYADDYYQVLRAQKDRSLIPFALQDVSKTFQAICTETIQVVIGLNSGL